MQVIDMETYLPGPGNDTPHPGQDLPGPPGPDRLPPPPDYGFAHYDTIFTRPAANEESSAQMSTAERADELVRLMDAAGVVKGLLSTSQNAVTVEAIKRHPGRLVGICHLSPYDGMRAVRELERLVKEDNIRGISVAALYDMVPASDRRYYPLYAKCVELDIPVRVYTAMTYASDRPYELGHPRHLDQVAMDFPELTIIAGLAGWPWVNDMVALLRRHGNLYCDTAAHRPRHFATPGSGWEQFLQFGNTLLQDKITVGLSSTLLGMSMEQVIEEYLALPLKDSVKEKWLYGNAARILNPG
ncbi:MAG: amidohydrolase family protein [Candidatus Dormiibacterota bacterium]